MDDFRKGIVYGNGGLFTRSAKLNKGIREEWEAFHAACVSGPPFPIPLDILRSVTETTFRIREEAMR